MIRRILTIFMVASAFLFIGAQCIRFQSGGTGVDGGIWKTTSAGQTWLHKVAVPTTGKDARTIASVDVISLVMDPQDRRAIVAGTRANGFFYSFDGAETWNPVSVLRSERVNAIAIDPKNKCVVYSAVAQHIIKTSDCYRSFDEVYLDPVSEIQITALAVDPVTVARVYAATSKGSVLVTENGGATWTSIQNFNGRVTSIVIDPRDSGTLYVTVAQVGLWKSMDAGRSWIDLTPAIARVAGLSSYALDAQKLVIARSSPNTLVLLAGRYGLIRSQDAGASWSVLKLLTEPGAVEIYGIAVSAKSEKTIYYGTASTFYRTTDGGLTWETNRLPTSRAPQIILVDPEDSKILYMGVIKLEK